MAVASPDTAPHTRRALLVGALGGISALAGHLARPGAVHGHDPDDVEKDALNAVSDTTRLQNTTNSKTVLWAEAYGSGIGVQGSSDSGRGVYGQSTSGRGVHGKSGSGFGGYFEGKVYTTKFYELTEILEPADPPANRARIFVKDLEGTQQLCVKFANGIVQCFATSTPI